ncbi:phospholipase A2 inhibitor subunit gamma B [Copidosoma floridanum]|uniref:phospholipase A2 inhibitor subunit gamma B n=1 Tax=Copidosoma floridanum TaxID=29053 RepID=UPI000C6FA899|nr:phospholipase A2 inhibitor subunit gamma B [Copidosoma floridanum]
MKLWSLALLLATFFSIGNALECHVCTNQEGNVAKCLNTVMTCEQGEDTCLTIIRWGSTPYWVPEAKKQKYVSKRCSSKKECEKIRRNNMPDCSHVGYLDWQCSDCCQGDKCNYYIISGSSKIGVIMSTNRQVSESFIKKNATIDWCICQGGREESNTEEEEEYTDK